MHKLQLDKMRFKFLIGLSAAILLAILLIVVFMPRFFSKNIIKPNDTNKVLSTLNTVKPDDANNILSTLTSNEFGGRLIGTPGNEKAGAYIAEQFKKIGLSTFDDYYYQEYNQAILESTEFTIIDKDGSSQSMTYGTDFANPYTQIDIDLDGEIVFKVKDVRENSIFIADDYNNTIVVDNAIKAGAAGVLIKLDKSEYSNHQSLFPLPLFSRTSPGYPVVYISTELYDQLKSSDVKSINIKYENKDTKLKNVIAKIPGKTHKKAIVISAHFDHIGTSGDNFYPGAADNASGVTVMLLTAQKILDYSRINPFDADIFFASFNSEESGLGGSRNFVEWITGKYEDVYDINVDTVGNNEGNLILQGDKTVSEDLLNAMSKVIQKYVSDYECQELGSGSDYYAFTEKGFCAVNFCQNIKIHTIEDTPDKIDISYLDKVSNIITDFLETNGNSDF